MPIWLPLSAFERQTIRALKRKATPEHLLRMALLLSGARTHAQVAPLVARYRQFVDSIKPIVAKEEKSYSKAKLLLKLLHFRLLQTQRKPYRTRYEKNQTRIDRLLANGTYNCLSSSVLYGILAMSFGFKVEGVEVPNHIFLQVRHRSFAEPIFVETTNYDGFGQKHDRSYYKNQEKRWSRALGIRPGTFEEFQRRKVHSFRYVLFSLSRVQHSHGMREKDRSRIREVAGYFSADERSQVNRCHAWNLQVQEMVQAKDWGRLKRFFERIENALLDLQRRRVRLKKLRHAITTMGLLHWQAAVHNRQWLRSLQSFERGRLWLVSLQPKDPKLYRFVKAVLQQAMYKLGQKAQTDFAERYLARVRKWKPLWLPMLAQRFWLLAGHRWFKLSRWSKAIQAFQTCLKQEKKSNLFHQCQRGLRAAQKNRANGF